MLDRYSDRSCSPDETLERVAPTLEEHGITRLSRLTSLDRIGIPVWTAIRPNAKSLSVAQGKGLTDAFARASATMEALERAVAEGPQIAAQTASIDALEEKGCTTDPLEEFVALGQSPPTRETSAPWIKAQSLLEERPILVPFESACLDRTRTARYWQSSDGLASGNTEEEAVFHGLLERIERDADTLWKLLAPKARRSTCFDPADLKDPIVDELHRQIRKAGLHLVLFDLTSDIGVPVVSAMIGPRPRELSSQGLNETRYIDVTEGSGAHPSASRAAIRAITEAVQSRLTLISGARDDVPAPVYQRPLPASVALDLGSLACCMPPEDLRGVIDGSIARHVGRLLANLRTSGVSRIYSARLNPHEDRFAVVKVLVPDLENPPGARRRRYGPRAMSRLVRFR
ncbi:YcaO-like family protein [Ciceribacter sp. L1K23]|uniref:YcaO-like family protein n=1 Tax=Ciceribacter sp. L1K23 TaxID=2820276 RepID=UPI001B836103|nr:YcaO-like family protein [Ciceribacter sp. L1K23]